MKQRKRSIGNVKYIPLLIIAVMAVAGFKMINSVNIAEYVFKETAEYVTERKEGAKSAM